MPDATTPHPETAPSGGLRTVHVVVNGAAGALLARGDAAETLRQAFAAVGLHPEFIPPEAGTLPERVRMAHAAGTTMVVVAGGDGTVACAAQVLAGTDTPLGILPCGTMNLLAKDLRIPVDDEAAAIRILAQGQARKIDIAEVNGHVFLCASMLGLPVRVGADREAQRDAVKHGGNKLRGWLRFAGAAVHTFRRYLPHRLWLRIGERTEVLRVPSLTIAANALDQHASRMFAREKLDGGELAVYIVKRMAVADLLRLSMEIFRGNWGGDPALRERRAEHLTISARRKTIRVMNDGELMVLASPLEYRIRPLALRVMAPAPDPEPATA